MKILLALMVVTILTLSWRVIYLQQKCSEMEEKEKTSPDNE
jgi:cell division protein FtsL